MAIGRSTDASSTGYKKIAVVCQ